MSADRFIIYPNFGQRDSSWDITTASGKYNIPLMDTTDSDSVLLYILDSKQNVKNIEYNHVKSKDLFTVGMNVTISNEINKYGPHVSGYISKINTDSVEIISDLHGQDRTYRINDYKLISAFGKSNQPDMLVANIKKEDVGKLKLSYLFGNIQWNAYYKVIIENNNIKSSTLSATIINQNSENLNGDVVLIAGSIVRPQSDTQIRSRSLVMDTQSVASYNEDHEKFDEYYRYNIGNQKLSRENRIDLVTCTNPSSVKYYSHDAYSRNTVMYGYKFKAPTFYPAGNVYLYSKENEDVIYTGTANLLEYREGDEVNLLIGKTTQVKAETNFIQVDRKVQIDDQDEKKQEIHEHDIIMETIIDNKTSNTILFIMKYRIGIDKLLNTSLPITRRKDGYIEWDVELNTNKTKINITLTTSS
jgi:hypothetical protein